MITLAQLRNFAGGSPEDEERLAILRDTVLSQWDALTGKTWAQETGIVDIFQMEGHQPTQVFLPRRPVTAVTTVEERLPTEATWTVIDPGDYLLADSKIGMVERVSGYFDQHVRVTYDGGHDETTVPKDIHYALLIQAQFLRKRNAEELLTIMSQNFEGGGGVYHSANAHPVFTATVKRYKQVNV